VAEAEASMQAKRAEALQEAYADRAGTARQGGRR
jgi:hypothetical protein